MSATIAGRYRAACGTLGLPVWRPGMRTIRPSGWAQPCAERVPEVLPNGAILGEPDFNDPATVGCLLAAAREAAGSETLFARPTASGWTVMRGSGAGMGKLSDGSTEADALVAALEAVVSRQRRGGAA